MKSKLIEVEFYPVSIPFRIPFVIASGEYLRNAEYILVKVVTAGGVAGWGESSPMPAFSGEGQTEVLYALRKKLRPIVLGSDLDRAQELFGRVQKAGVDSPYAAAGIELALRDAYARMKGVPLYVTLGGKMQESVEAVWPIGLGSNEFLEEQVRWAKRHGFREVKLKVGRNLKQDLERIEIARGMMGKGGSVRVDANQGYNAKDAFKFASKLEGVHILEQPVARDELDVLRKLRTVSKAKVMVDESCYSPADAINVTTSGAADIINIKIMKAGGLGPSAQIEAISAASGIPNSLGSMLETGIATAAGIHFYVSRQNIRLRSEIVGPLFLQTDIVRGLRIRGGSLYLPVGEGIGVQVMESRIIEFTKKIVN